MSFFKVRGVVAGPGLIYRVRILRITCSSHETMLTDLLISSVLLNSLNYFQGILILTTSWLSAIDYSIKPYIKQEIWMPELTHRERFHIFCASLEKTAKAILPHGALRQGMLDWFNDAINIWYPSGHEVRDIVVNAANQAFTEGRDLLLDDLISAYTEKTGNKNDWDFVSNDDGDNTFVYDKVETPERPQTPLTASAFQELRLIPDDGRLPLQSAEALLQAFGARPNTDICDDLNKCLKDLRTFADLCIVDWGWPKGLWERQTGCVYKIHASGSSQNKPALEQWRDAEFTFGLRRSLKWGFTDRDGKPWRRLV